MATESETDAGELDLETEADAPEGSRKTLTGKRLMFFGVLPLLVLAGGAGAYLSGVAEPLFGLVGLAPHGTGEHAPKPVVYYDLPEILVNLNGTGKKNSFLRLKVALELDEGQNVKLLEKVLPRVIDNFQLYLRELRLEDLQGSAGVFRLKEELLIRVNASVEPIRVNDILFKEMIVQ